MVRGQLTLQRNSVISEAKNIHRVDTLKLLQKASRVTARAATAAIIHSDNHGNPGSTK